MRRRFLLGRGSAQETHEHSDSTGADYKLPVAWILGHGNGNTIGSLGLQLRLIVLFQVGQHILQTLCFEKGMLLL